jgi:hypothetical protein
MNTMKNQINFFTLFILFALCSSQALGNNIDSCYTLLAPDTLCCNEDIFDSTNSSLDTCSLVPNKQNMVLESNKTQTLINNHKTNIRKLTTNQQQKQYVFWGSLWSAVKNIFDFVTAPVSPVWGAYEEKGQNTAAPLALFKRSSFAQDKAYVIAKSINNK